MKISVCVCTHNPREDYLSRTLQALREQTLPQEWWELLLIDSASTEVLSNRWNLQWHRNSRHFREEEAGLTPARLRGIAESKGEILVFVDDDNALGANYLKIALEIGEEFAMLGTWGGSTIGDYETTPPDWFLPYAGWIGVREIAETSWSNDPLHAGSNPIGAGMVVRRVVARKYAAEIVANESRRMLDRRGGSLMSGGDFDIVYTGCSMGLGKGVFPQLILKHLIPCRRYEEKYVEEILEMISFSKVVHHYSRGLPLPTKDVPRGWRSLGRKMRQKVFPTRERRFWEARQRGLEKGYRFVNVCA